VRAEGLRPKCHSILGWLLILASGAIAEAADPWRASPEPIVFNYTAPAYPSIAQQARIQGIQRVRLTLDQTGHTTQAVCEQYVTSFSYKYRAPRPGAIPLLCDAVVAAVTQWEYEPSEAESRSAMVDFIFELLPPDATEGDLRSRFLAPSVFTVRQPLPEAIVVRVY
jgi:hypothetical protein